MSTLLKLQNRELKRSVEEATTVAIDKVASGGHAVRFLHHVRAYVGVVMDEVADYFVGL